MVWFRIRIHPKDSATLYVGPWRHDNIRAVKSAIHINVSLGRNFDVEVRMSKPEEVEDVNATTVERSES